MQTGDPDISASGVEPRCREGGTGMVEWASSATSSPPCKTLHLNKVLDSFPFCLLFLCKAALQTPEQKTIDEEVISREMKRTYRRGL